jgi:hypothetical protein
VSQSPAIRAGTVHQFAVISAAIIVQLQCKLDFKTVEFMCS